MCISVMKCALVTFNGLFLLIGLTLAGLAAYINWVEEDIKNYLELLNFGEDFQDLDTDNDKIQIAMYAVIGLGLLIALISFMGCCGACCQSSCMLNFYCFLCGLLLLGEITVAALSIVFKDEIESTLEDGLTNQVETGVTSNGTDVLTIAWDRIQQELECCGSQGPEDYILNENFDDETPVPKSCCIWKDGKPDNLTLCYKQASNVTGVDELFDADMEYVYQKGCYEVLLDWFDDKVLFFIIGGFAVGFIQIFGIVFACSVKREIPDEK